MRGAWLAGRHLVESGAHGFWYVGRSIDRAVPLGERPEEALLVELRESEAAPGGDRDVGCDAQHRDRGLVRLDKAGQDVRRAATARALAYADFPRHAGVSVGHVGRRALIPRKDVLHAMVEALQRVIEREARIATQAEDVLDA